jgi:carboxymethylenebutenolidase
MREFISYGMQGGSIGLHVERPKAASAPVVVVLHEVFGINDDVRASCRELADRGFLAICPDLFWRIAPGFSLSQWTEADLPRVNELYGAFDRDRAADDIAEVLTFARSMDGSNGRAGLMGYCMGGLMAFLTTARYGADATVAYYPGQAELYLNEADTVSTPMIVHLGEEDEYISHDAQREIREAFAANASVTVYSYPGCSHAFARHSGDHFDAAAAALANGRTWDFLDASLK